ncbi:SRPBCC family protein [Streptomyces sp. NRRL S-4]|uniref:SRPBCC family protein n=1 Tax=Streptomyces sp. NRRL S-4 TaxID=1519471 RepID=UPI0006B56D74|nr:SRPBCC family protein [Streptomyces sp. NRRL S-4]
MRAEQPPGGIEDRAAIAFRVVGAGAPRRCLPGAVLDTLAGDSFTGRVKVKVGAVQMSYRGEGTVTRDDATRSMHLGLSGSETRGAGTVSATVTATLTADPAGTLVRVRTDLDITGRPAQFGRGIMTEVGDRIVQQFATRLEELLRTPGPGAAETVCSPLPHEPEAVDLGAAALPVLLRKAAVPAAAFLVAVVVVQALRRRSRR